MSKEIIVNVDPRETRVALVDSGRLIELHIERQEQVVGSLYKCKVNNVLAGMDAAFVEIGLERNAFLYVADVLPEMDDECPAPRRDFTRRQKIKDVLKPNQELLVQVVKSPRGSKGARVSTRISLPGRYLVLMPDADSNGGISRKIESEAERDRLRKIADSMRIPGIGIILRTEAEGQSEKEIRNDLDFLVKMWSQIQEKSATEAAPALIHQDLSLLYKIIRDSFGHEYSKMIIDDAVAYEKALELMHLLSPKMKSKLELHDGVDPIFEKYGLESEIDKLLKRNIWLKSGGRLIIDQTEALTTIDVNTGKFVGSTSLSDTIVKTNLDAVSEIARQLRLRDIGGMIVIDFIDMIQQKDRARVIDALEKELNNDRTKSKICHISPLGLVEMTRKRTGETITELLTETCPYCLGAGRIESPETVSIKIQRELRKLIAKTKEEAYVIYANPEVIFHLVGGEGEIAEDLERELQVLIYIRAEEEMHQEKFEIQPVNINKADAQMVPWKNGDVIECTVIKNPFGVLPAANAWADGVLVEIANGGKYLGRKVKVNLTDVKRSILFGEVPVQEKKKKSRG